MKAIVTGAAGFLGSHLVDRLLGMGYSVVGVDNLSWGDLGNLSRALGSRLFEFVRGDVLGDEWARAAAGSRVLFHFSANPEVRHALREPMSHYEQNLTATMKALEVARRMDVEYFVFASSSTVYGDPDRIPTPEDAPIRPISIYGATKAAGEVLCRTYSRLYSLRCLVLRYANVVGPRLRHGVIYDFIVKLKRDPARLEVLGDGTQRKSYLHVEDAVDATIRSLRYMEEAGLAEATFNVGSEDWISVAEIGDIVSRAMLGRRAELVFKPGTPDGRGWPGDVKLMLLDTGLLRSRTGWAPRMSCREAVERATRELLRELAPRGPPG